MTRLQAIEIMGYQCTTAGSPAEIVEWHDGRPQPETWEEIFAEAAAVVAAAGARAQARSALRQQWVALPSWIRGPYRDAFESVNALLDEGDDVAAADLVNYQEPKAGYSPEQVATFEQVKAAFVAGVVALPD